jgi:hypothetical protein
MTSRIIPDVRAMRTIASVEVEDAGATVGRVLVAVPGAASGFHEQKGGARWVQRVIR